MTDFPTGSDLISWLTSLNISPLPDTSTANRCVEHAKRIWLKVVGYDAWIAASETTKTFDDGRWLQWLVFHTPVIDVSSIKSDSRTLTSDEYRLYPLDGNRKTALQAPLAFGDKLEVTGWWGYAKAGDTDAVPADVWNAVLKYAGYVWVSDTENADISSVRQGDVSFQFDADSKRVAAWQNILHDVAQYYRIVVF